MKKLRNLGIMGKMASGKGFASKFLAKRYGYKVINMSDVVRNLAKKEHLEPTRANLRKLGEKYSKIHKHDFVIEKALEKTENTKKPLIIEGLRKPIQVKIAKKKLKVVLIEVYASPIIRFERMKKRRREKDPKTFKRFQKAEIKEDKFFRINRALKQVDYTVGNDDGEKQFLHDLNEVVKKINKE